MPAGVVQSFKIMHNSKLFPENSYAEAILYNLGLIIGKYSAIYSTEGRVEGNLSKRSATVTVSATNLFKSFLPSALNRYFMAFLSYSLVAYKLKNS